MKTNPDSLIARIYGIYQVEMEGIVPVNLLLMANTIQKINPRNITDKIYDLKGSYINRLVVKGENQTKKDRNLINAKKGRMKKQKSGMLQFGVDELKMIKKQIEADANFLMGEELLDYSLLLAIEEINHENNDNLRLSHFEAHLQQIVSGHYEYASQNPEDIGIKR